MRDFVAGGRAGQGQLLLRQWICERPAIAFVSFTKGLEARETKAKRVTVIGQSHCRHLLVEGTRVDYWQRPLTCLCVSSRSRLLLRSTANARIPCMLAAQVGLYRVRSSRTEDRMVAQRRALQIGEEHIVLRTVDIMCSVVLRSAPYIL